MLVTPFVTLFTCHCVKYEGHAISLGIIIIFSYFCISFELKQLYHIPMRDELFKYCAAITRPGGVYLKRAWLKGNEEVCKPFAQLAVKNINTATKTRCDQEM
jgi:hypothetical protein